MSNNTTYASRHTDCGFAMEVISDSLSIYKVSKRGNESLSKNHFCLVIKK